MTLCITITILVQTLFGEALPEYALKSAYLYNFALLTEWVEVEETTSFNLCFYKKDFGVASDMLNGKKIQDKEIHTSTIDTFEEAQNCQMVFIREGQKGDTQKLVEALSGKQILIVSENEQTNNAHITILRDHTKLAFTINMKSLQKTELHVSSRLLKLAKKVQR